MAKVPDWAEFADKLNREREAIQDRLPAGLVCWVSIDCFGFRLPDYLVTITEQATKISGTGTARTPRKAAAEAVKDFQKKQREANSKPRLASAEVKALPPANPVRSLFD